MAHKTPCPPPLPIVTIDSPLSSDNMKPLFWTKVVPSSRNTIWQRVSECQKIISFDEEKFLQLFQKKGDIHRVLCMSPRPVSPLRILNDKKYQAIQILLRNISCDDIIHLMESPSYVKQCSFDVSCLSNVATMITVNELKKLRSCSPHSLEQPEKLVLQLFETENFREKVTCLKCMAQYHDTFPTIKKQLLAFKEVYELMYKPNDKLCQVLAIILKAGNKMNASSATRRNAFGFRFDILPELKSVRSSDGSSSLLEFVVQSYVQCQSIAGTDGSKLRIDFPLPEYSKLVSAASVNLLDLKNHCKNLESDLKDCKKCCSQMHNSDNFYEETIVFIDKSFHDLASIFKEIKDLDRLFDSVICYYSLEGKDRKTTSEEFLQYWISFIQSFLNHWDKAIQASSTTCTTGKLMLETSPSTSPMASKSRKGSYSMANSTSIKIETDV